MEEFLKSFDIFEWWTKREKLGEILGYLKEVKTKTIGDIIYKAGSRSDKMYLLKEGEVEITYEHF